jgi:hypothetical protein
MLHTALLAPIARSHRLKHLGPIHVTGGEPLVASPQVLLFVHVPKCGGSTVRSIFRKTGRWYMTYWALTQQIAGWHQNQLLHGIHEALGRNYSRVFVEWHIDINMSFLPELKSYVRRMRPDVRVSSFTILRDPLELVASTSAYWLPTRAAVLSLRLMSEHLIFGVIYGGRGISALDARLRSSGGGDRGGSGGARGGRGSKNSTFGASRGAQGHGGGSAAAAPACAAQPSLCEEAARFEAETRFFQQHKAWPNSRLSARHRALISAPRRVCVDHTCRWSWVAVAGGLNVTADDVKEASIKLAAREAIRKLVDDFGCKLIVADALDTVRHGLDKILWLEDNASMPTLHAIARGERDTRSGAPSFHPPPEPWAEAYLDHPRSASNRPEDLRPFRTRTALAVGREENVCSLEVASRLRLQQRP